MDNSIIITGAAGFIGWKTSLKFLQEGQYIIGIDNMNDYYDIRLKEYRLDQLQGFSNFSFYRTDIEDYGSIEDIFKDNRVNAVINLAARAGVRYSLIDPDVYLSTNTLGTLNILKLMYKYGIKKFVLASTSSLYAGQNMPFNEDLAVNTPISPYAATKKAAELMAYTYHYLYGIDVTVLRYFTVYGPCGRPDMSIFRFIKWVDEEIPIELFGDGTQSRDFTFVNDIAEGTKKAVKRMGYEIINLGGGKSPVSMNYIISLIEKELGKKAKIDQRPFHKADLTATWANIEKAGSLLDWKPVVSVEQGVAESVKWYIDNRHWIKDIKLF